MCWPATIPTPRPACTKTLNSANTVNHHSARVRSASIQLAPSDHRPASALPKMTTHAHPLWTSSSEATTGTTKVFGTETGAMSPFPCRKPSGLLRSHLLPGHLLHRLRLGHGLGRDVDQLGDLFLTEPGHGPEL